MVTLTVDNSSCLIVGLDATKFKRLSHAMSYTIDSDRAGYGGPKYRRKLLTARGEFPTGLLYIAKAILKQFKIPYRLLEKRIEPTGISGKFKIALSYDPYPEQELAALYAGIKKR